jgi:predicted transcriptional regulator
VAATNPNIRISPRSKAALKEIAKREGKPMQAVLDEAIGHYQREKFLDEVNAAYARLRTDPKAWKEELAERQIWDQALRDGIEKE